MTSAGKAAVAALLPHASRSDAAASYEAEYPDMLAAYLARRLNAWAEKWERIRGEIRTAAQMGQRNGFVRERFRSMIHGLPERTPLQAVTVRRFERPGYRVENVMFQSRPDFWVTGNLYLPAGGNGPFPGTISPCGHSDLGRMHQAYQTAHVDMVRSGMAVFAYDPIGQGERRRYWDPRTGKTDDALVHRPTSSL